MKKLDLPPVWTLLTLALMALLDRAMPIWWLDWPILDWLGYLEIAGALALILWSAVHFMRAKTPIHPGKMPSALITDGPFKLSRNPIYLGFISITLGFALILGSLSPLIGPLLLWAILGRRFVQHEEALASSAFGEAWERYQANVGRWL